MKNGVGLFKCGFGCPRYPYYSFYTLEGNILGLMDNMGLLGKSWIEGTLFCNKSPLWRLIVKIQKSRRLVATNRKLIEHALLQNSKNNRLIANNRKLVEHKLQQTSLWVSSHPPPPPPPSSSSSSSYLF